MASERNPGALTALCEQVIELAKARGASVADACASAGNELTIKVRDGVVDSVKEAGSRSIGLRIIEEQRVGLAYTSDTSEAGLQKLAEDAWELTKLTEPDEAAALADAASLAGAGDDGAGLELLGTSPDAETVKGWALAADGAQRDTESRVISTDGTAAGTYWGAMALVTSHGFAGAFQSSSSQIVAGSTVKDADGKNRNAYDWSVGRRFEDLAAAEDVGKRAAARAVSRLGARKIKTGKYPVVFHPDAGRQIIGNIFGLVSGDALYRGSTFLAGREGSQVASELITLVDDPLMAGRLGSRPWDGEGAKSRVNLVIEQGELKTFLFDTYSANRCERKSTASAGRSPGSSPSVGTSNWRLEPGSLSQAEILKETGTGLMVDSLMGYGFNPVTGTYSQGAAGYWIENGEIAYPVSEVTISAEFEALLKGIDRVGADLDWRSSTIVPTFRVSEMTVGGAS